MKRFNSLFALVFALAVLVPGVLFAASQPDLMVASIVRAPASPTVGKTVTFSVQVLNIGSTATSASSVSADIVGSTHLGTQSVFALAAGESHARTFSWVPQTAGTVTFRACADSASAISELNEQNNCATQSVTVAAGTITPTYPDLVTQNISFLPSQPVVGHPVSFSAIVHNSGTADASISNAELRIDAGANGSYDTALPPRFTPALDANQSTTLSFLWTPTSAGLYAMQVCADRGNAINESDESNNCRTTTLNVTSGITPPPQPSNDFSADLRVATNGFSWVQSFSGTAPLNGVDLRADITADRVEPVDLVFYCDRPDSGTQITSGWAERYNGFFGTRRSVFDICNYQSAGTYVAKLISVRNGIAHEDRATIIVSPGSGGPTTEIPQIILRAVPITINRNETSVLTWTAQNAERCTASGGWSGRKSTTGTRSVSPDRSSTYILTCSNDFGSDSTSVRVNIDGTSGGIGLEFRANPTLIRAGENATLIWTTNDADVCAASGGWSGRKSDSGAKTVTPTKTTTYTLSCVNDGSIARLSRDVRVSGNTSGGGTTPAPQPQPAFSLFCSANPQTITLGQLTTFSAQVTGATLPVQHLWTGLASGSGSSSAVRPARAGVQAATVTATDNSGRQRAVTCFVSVLGAAPVGGSVSTPPTEAPDRLTYGGFTIPAFPQDIPIEQEGGFTARIFDGLDTLLLWLFLVLFNITLIIALVYLWRRIEEEHDKIIETEEQQLA